MKKIGWPIICVFLLKPFKQWICEKLQVFCRVFSQKNIVFQWRQFRNKFSLNFCFASFDSLKAVTGCRVLNSSLHFKYTDLKFIFDRTMVWFDRFFCFEQKNYSFEAVHLRFKILLVRFSNKRMNSSQTGWPSG